mmetsp:Transcript_66229/g.215507  ORF Transcript_66229/g.215507 Transcript_66229/m.215507 type:complete len:118 (-) Transcript_66229:213-566(-)
MNGLHCMLVFLLRGPRVSQVDIMHLHRPLFLFSPSLSLMVAATGFATPRRNTAGEGRRSRLLIPIAISKHLDMCSAVGFLHARPRVVLFPNSGILNFHMCSILVIRLIFEKQNFDNF